MPIEVLDNLGNPGGTLDELAARFSSHKHTGLDGSEPLSSSVTNPGGSDTQVQFNDAGAFGGDSTFTFNKTTDELSLTNLVGNDTSLGLQLYTPNPSGASSRPISVGTGFVLSGTGASGSLDFYTGAPSGASNSGPITIEAGFSSQSTRTAGTTGTGGTIYLYAGNGGSSSGNGGDIQMFPGRAKGGNASAGDVFIDGNDGIGSGTGSEIFISAGNGGSTGNGGKIVLTVGTGNGGGTNGVLTLENLPTSSAGLNTEDVWNNNGILNIGTGSAALSKASGTDVDTGTDDSKYVTAKALNDSHNVPDVAPGTSGNVMTSNGTDWTSGSPTAVSPQFLRIKSPQETLVGVNTKLGCDMSQTSPTYLWLCKWTASTGFTIWRLDKQASGNYVYKGVTVTVSDASYVRGMGITEMGSKVYHWYRTGTTTTLHQFTTALGSETNITGITAGANDVNNDLTSDDGSHLVFLTEDDIVRRFTVSGTSASLTDTITLSSSPASTNYSLLKLSGGNIYIVANRATGTVPQTLVVYGNTGTHGTDVTTALYGGVSDIDFGLGFVKLGAYMAYASAQKLDGSNSWYIQLQSVDLT